MSTIVRRVRADSVACCHAASVLLLAARAEPTRPRAGIFLPRPPAIFCRFCSPDGGRRVGLTYFSGVRAPLAVRAPHLSAFISAAAAPPPAPTRPSLAFSGLLWPSPSISGAANS